MKTVEGRLAASMMVLLLLLTVTPVLAVPVSEPQGTIRILADGNIDPLDAPIQRSGNLYVFTNNASAKLVVSRSDIVIDGGEYTLEGNGTGIGISMAGVNNVTVRNTKVYGFEHGISLSGTHNKVYNNVAVDNTWIGIGMCAGSNNNTVYENRINGSKFGLWFCTSSNNTIYANIVTVISPATVTVGFQGIIKFEQTTVSTSKLQAHPNIHWTTNYFTVTNVDRTLDIRFLDFESFLPSVAGSGNGYTTHNNAGDNCCS